MKCNLVENEEQVKDRVCDPDIKCWWLYVGWTGVI